MAGGSTTFPSTYSIYSTEALLAAYAAAPDRYRQALDGLDEEHLQARPITGKWSILEIVAHVADAEAVGAARARQVFAQPGSPLITYDQDVWAREFCYRELDDLEPHLRSFAALRATTLPIFERAGEDDWRKTGRHADWGAVTLRNVLELYADHGERHIGQILERRALLGAPIELAMLLETRLY